MATIHRQSVRNLSRVLSFSGIILTSFVNTSFIGFLGYIRMYLSPIGVSGATLSIAVYMYKHRSQFGEFVIGLPFLCCGLTLMVSFFAFVKMRRKLDYLLQMINENIFTYTQESQIQVKYSWLCSETNTQMIHFFVFLSQFIGFVTNIAILYEHFILNKTKSLCFPGWTPWDPEEHFMVTFLMQSVLEICVGWLMFITQLFIVFVAIEFSRQNTRLCAALTSIHLRTENTVMMKTMSVNQQNKTFMKNLLAVEFEHNLKQCIRHHQILTELFCVFKSWFTILFQFELLADSSTFAVVFYNFFQTNTEVTYVVLSASSYIFITTLFTRCVVGEIFSDMNEKIAKVIFHEVRWYEQSLNNKRLLSIFHTQVHRPMDLYAFSIFKASFLTFTSLMRSSYSYLNILKASFSSKN